MNEKMDNKWGSFLLKVLHGLLRRAYTTIKPDDDSVSAKLVVRQQWFELLDRFPRMNEVTRYTMIYFLNKHYPVGVQFMVSPITLSNFGPILDEFVTAFHGVKKYWSKPMNVKLDILNKLLNGAMERVILPTVHVLNQDVPDEDDKPDPDAECPPTREIDLDDYHPVSQSSTNTSPMTKPKSKRQLVTTKKVVVASESDSDDDAGFVPDTADLSQFSACK